MWSTVGHGLNRVFGPSFVRRAGPGPETALSSGEVRGPVGELSDLLLDRLEVESEGRAVTLCGAPAFANVPLEWNAGLSQAEAIDPSVTSPLCAAKAARTSSFSRGGTPK